ncbi:hypothetical protein FQZ97_893340 [compost metagenome]
MGVELVHQHIVAAGVELATLVAGHHPRGNSGGTQHEGHRPGVVGTEATAGIEEEGVDIVRPQGRRLQGVDKGLALEMSQQRVHQLLRLGVPLLQLRSPGAAARIALRRQLQGTAQGRRVTLGLAQRSGPGGDLIEQWPLHRPTPFQGEVGPGANALRACLGHVQAEQPGPGTGLHDDAVA